MVRPVLHRGSRPAARGERAPPGARPAPDLADQRPPGTGPRGPGSPDLGAGPAPTWPTNGHRAPDPADPAVPTWAQDPPPTWPTNGHRAPDPADPAVPTWAQDPPPTWPTNGHRAPDPADPAVPTWAQDPPPTWPTNGRAADPDAAEWVREWPPAPPSNGHRAPDPARPAWADEPGSWPAGGRADDPDPRWDGGGTGHGRAPGGPRVEQPRPQPNGYPDQPEDRRRPARWPYAAPADDAGLEPDTLSGWDAVRYSPPPVVRRPANGHVAPPDERPGAATAFTLDPGTGRVDLPAASPPPPLRPATRPPAPPLPDPVPVRAEPPPRRAPPRRAAHRRAAVRRRHPAAAPLRAGQGDAGPGGPRAPVRRPPTLPKHPPRAVVRRRRVRRRLLEWPFLIVFALLSAYLIRAYVVQTFYIPSGSMHETLLEGDRVLVNKVGYHLHEVGRGDVVVFRRPPDFPVEDEDLIKRVVALPGETVEGRGRQVYVDGERCGAVRGAAVLGHRGLRPR